MIVVDASYLPSQVFVDRIRMDGSWRHKERTCLLAMRFQAQATLKNAYISACRNEMLKVLELCVEVARGLAVERYIGELGVVIDAGDGKYVNSHYIRSYPSMAFANPPDFSRITMGFNDTDLCRNIKLSGTRSELTTAFTKAIVDGARRVAILENKL